MQSARVVEAVGKHTGTVIFLHVSQRSTRDSQSLTNVSPGLGRRWYVFHSYGATAATSTSSSQVHSANRQDATDHAQFGLSHASVSVSAHNPPKWAKALPFVLSWFDVRSLDKLSNSVHDDEAGMLESVASVESLIDKELQTISEDRIIVGGFSQGCVISVLTGLKTKRKIAGVIGLSGWVPLNHKIAEMAAPGAKDLAIFWGHGKQDGVVQYQCEDALATCVSDDVILIQSLGTDGEMSAKLLQNLGLPLVDGFARPGLRFQGYDGVEHSFSDKVSYNKRMTEFNNCWRLILTARNCAI